MADQNWINRACDLEAQGKPDEARALMLAHEGPGSQAALLSVSEVVCDALWPEARTIAAQMEAARALPEGDERKEPWMAVADAPFERIERWWLLGMLPNLFRRGQGRPKGSAPVATDERLSEMERRVSAGELPTHVARSIIDNEGDAFSKSQIKTLVRAYGKRCK